MRLIDADKLTADSELITSMVSLIKSCRMQHRSGCCAPNCNECLSRTFKPHHSHLAPTVEAEPIRYGEWIEDDYGFFHCSECGFEFDEPEKVSPYCQNCGAKMEEADK